MLYDIVLALLIQFAPVDRLPQFPGYEETPAEAQARYREIARDIVNAAEGPGPFSRAGNAFLLSAMAIGESGLALDVDRGPCYRKGSWVQRCDGGRAQSIWQVWHPERLTRAEAARLALKRLRASWYRCKALPPKYRLSAYGAGRCMELEGAAARWRLYLSIRARSAAIRAELLSKDSNTVSMFDGTAQGR